MIAVPSIDLKQGHVARWESATGFYELRLFRDLFGYPVGRSSHMGPERRYAHPDAPDSSGGG